MNYLESLNNSLHKLMEQNDNLVLLGEDLLDPYGGAFKVSKGLSTKFPKQVITTPISEQAIVGSAIGMAMGGMKPIVEIMFGDFLTLCVDQIVNHATKYSWMYNEKISVPILIRTPMGGGRGYGPTHSQSLESLFLSVSGLEIYAPSIFHDPGKVLERCVERLQGPVLFIENKTAYPKKIQRGNFFKEMAIFRNMDETGAETVHLSLYPEESSDVVLVTYGGMAELCAEAAMEIFIDDEVLVEVVVLERIRNAFCDFAVKAAKKCGRVIVVEEGNKIGGWGAEVSSIIHENAFSELRFPVVRVGAEDFPIPSAMPLERIALPTVEKIKTAINEIIED